MSSSGTEPVMGPCLIDYCMCTVFGEKSSQTEENLAPNDLMTNSSVAINCMYCNHPKNRHAIIGIIVNNIFTAIGSKSNNDVKGTVPSNYCIITVDYYCEFKL